MSNKRFQEGLQLYKAGKYQEALECLDQAMETGGQDNFILFDTRAAIHAKLGQNRDALKDAKKTIDLAPDRFHGYARAARGFLACNNADAAEKMVSLSLSKLRETETERRPALLSLRADVQRLRASLEAQRIRSINHIEKLPIEIFADIAMLLIEEDHTRLISLLHVCKKWQQILKDSPRFWSKLVLTQRRPKLKAKTWIEWSLGKVQDLTVKHEATSSKNWTWDSLHGLQWDQLRSCSAGSGDLLAHVNSIGQQSSIASWKGLEIQIHSVSVPHVLPRIRPACLALQRLSLSMTVFTMEGENELISHVSKLRMCSIRRGVVRGMWSDFFRRNSLLESLHLSSLQLVGQDSQPPEALWMTHLTTLELEGQAPADILSAKMPQLQEVKLWRPKFNPGAFLQHLLDGNIGHLTNLQLHSCMLHDMGQLIAVLETSPNLQILEITQLVAGVAFLMETLAAHYVAPSSKSRFPEDESRPGPLFCPKLTHVNFSGCPEVQTGPLLRLIKSRLPENPALSPSTSADDVAVTQPQIAKLESLIINSCPNVAGDWLPQIRALVPHVSCIYITKQQVRMSRS